MFHPEYLAGIVDGEGHLAIVKHTSGSYTPRLAVGSTTKRLLDELAHDLGGKTYLLKCRNVRAKAAWIWQLSGAPVMELLSRIGPLLLVKKTQAQLILAVPRFHQLNGKRWTTTQLQTAAAYHDDMVDVNRRGSYEV